jgi:hypothetical protein
MASPLYTDGNALRSSKSRTLKIWPAPADPTVMQTLDEKAVNQRSSLRLTMLQEEPVYLRITLGGEIDLPVTELGGGGARLVCYKCRRDFESWFAGHSLGPSVLVLPGNGMNEVQPIVRWMNWPLAGVQFVDLANKDRADIFRFLFKLERIKRKRMNGGSA